MGIKETLGGIVGPIIGFIPNLVSALIILTIGLLVAWALRQVTRRLLHALGVDRFMARHQVLPRAVETKKASDFGGRIVYWVVALVTFVAAADALRLRWVSRGLASIISFLPRILAAGLIVLLGYVLGNAAHRVLTQRGTTEGGLLAARLSRGVIYGVAAFMALQELNVADDIVRAAFVLTLGAMAVAFAVAFGFGNRELAGRVTRDWYERSRRRFDLSASGPVQSEPPELHH